MANDKQPPEAENPFLKLNDEALKHLDQVGKELDAAEAMFGDLDELGFETARVRERIAYGKKAREIILKHLGPKK